MDIYSREITDLLDVIETVRRRKIVDKDYSNIIYIDPLNHVSKLKIQNNHIISGRRGCGKTTIMLASMKDRENYIPITIECQNHRRDIADNIIINFLIKVLEIVQENVFTYRKSQGIFKYVSTTSKELQVFEIFVDSIISNLSNLKSMPESIQYKIKATERHNEINQMESNKSLNFNGGTTLEADFKFQKASAKVNMLSNIVANKVSSITNINEKTTESEHEHIELVIKEKVLDDLVETIAYILTENKVLTNKEISLYLDDFYQIPLEKQVRVIQYFHDIYKNCENKSFCFKICTLPNRLKINYEGENILSLKDDFSTINLDKNLSDIETTKDYLLQIVSSLNKDLNIKPRDLEQLFTNKDALINLIIGSGGIPRDFLIMFADVINSVRASNESNINKSIIYSVVNAMRIDKDENIEFDADITMQMVESAKQEIENEIVTNKNTNVFLFSHNESEEKLAIMKNLVNSRYLHIIKENTSSENKKKEMFTAYLVDMSFYINGKQKRRNFNDRPFWERDSKSRLKHIESAPIFKFKEIETKDEKIENK